LLRRVGFDLRYRFGRPPWDTGITPPELEAFVAETRAGRALDLGCGTGTNVLYLARYGWDATGVDFAARAIDIAKRRAQREGMTATFAVADVTRLPDFGAPFDLILDIGCLHSVLAKHRADYARGVRARLAVGGAFLVYAFAPPSEFGITREEVAALMAPLRLESYVEGRGRPSAWYRFA